METTFSILYLFVYLQDSIFIQCTSLSQSTSQYLSFLYVYKTLVSLCFLPNSPETCVEEIVVRIVYGISCGRPAY